MTNLSRLGLGGHTFIEKLGCDAPASPEEQRRIVEACLDGGITFFDTTYFGERVALGRILEEIGRRDEATIAAWNFFDPGPEGGDLPAFTPLGAGHLQVMLDELRTDVLDMLVVHAVDRLADCPGLRLARQWKAEGRVRQIAVGMCYGQHLDQLASDSGVDAILTPLNAFAPPEVRAAMRRAGEMGLTVVALSPFVRGWKLDALAERGVGRAYAAEQLLRWTLSEPAVDSAVVAMRQSEYVAANLAAAAKGPLSDDERCAVESWPGLLDRGALSKRMGSHVARQSF